MPGKSLDDILRQMQAQRAAEQQQRMAQERALYEQRERLRQEYLQRMRMYEFASPNFSPSSAAAGAGGGGNRQTPATSAPGESILYWNFEEGKFSYFIYNFEAQTLTEIKEISLSDSPSIIPVTRGGFFLRSLNEEGSNYYDLLFISLNGEVIWQDTTSDDSNVDIENFSRYVAAYYLKDGIWKLEVFNEDGEQRSFEFGNPIEGGGYSYDDVWNGGFVVREDVGTIQKYYIINFSEGTKTQFHEVDNDLGELLNVYQYAYSDKILSVKNGDLWEVFSSNGTLLSSFDAISEFETSGWYVSEFTFLDDNGSFLIFGFDNDTSDYTIILYSGEQNTFSTKVVGNVEFPSYDFDINYQKNYDSTENWKADGSAIFLFYSGSEEENDITTYEEARLLPVWSSDSELRDFYIFSSVGASPSVSKGLNDNLDDSDISFSRSSEHICLLVENEIGDENYSILRLNRTGEEVTIIETDISITRELDDDDQINGKTILQFERGLTTSATTWGWTDLSDVEDRFYYSFYLANNESIGNYVVDQELILKDVENDQYWAIKFLDWESSEGGGFEYTRQLISGGTFSGDLIHFTFSSWEQEESDVISAGVLEIRRAFNGSIYNSAKEGESNGRNPVGTLWNSQWVYNPSESYTYQWWETDGTNPTSSTPFNALFSGAPTASGRTYGESIDWTSDSGKPDYLPSENFAWQVDCLLKVEVAGSYLFNTMSDDGNQLTINGNVVTEFYGGRGMSNSDTSSAIELSVGFHSFRYRMQQGEAGSGARVKWQGPEDGTFSVIPSTNLVINDPIIEYDHYIVSTEGQIVGSVSTGDEYDNEYEGKTYILEDRVFNKTWISNTQNSENWTLLDRYYEEYENLNNTISSDGVRTGIILLQNGFNYRIITEQGSTSNIVVPSTGSVLNKIGNDGIFHKGFWVRTSDETNEWLRFYNIEGVLIDSIQSEEGFDNFDSWSYGNRCTLVWEKDGTKRVAIFNGESVIQLDSGYSNIGISVNDYIWWDD
jgi:hypothetical protein